MARFFAARFFRDARHYQIAALSTLVVFNLGWIDFGARPANTALALTASLLTQIVCSCLTDVPIDLRSPLITGLSLSLLLAHRGAADPRARRRYRDRLEILAAHRRQAHLESGRLRHRGAAVRDTGPRLDFARKLGLAGVVRGAARVLRDPGARRRAPLRHRDLLLRHARGTAVRPRALARRSVRDSRASAAERLAADLHLLHDLRPAHLARLAARPLHLRGLGRGDRRTTWRSSCRCGRRFTSR